MFNFEIILRTCVNMFIQNVQIKDGEYTKTIYTMVIWLLQAVWRLWIFWNWSNKLQLYSVHAFRSQYWGAGWTTFLTLKVSPVKCCICRCQW